MKNVLKKFDREKRKKSAKDENQNSAEEISFKVLDFYRMYKHLVRWPSTGSAYWIDVNSITVG